jgi:hypothetical protein
VTQIFSNGKPIHDGDCKVFEVVCWTFIPSITWSVMCSGLLYSTTSVLLLRLWMESTTFITVNSGWEWSVTTKWVILVFLLCTFHLYVATLQHLLRIEHISFIWCDILEFAIPIILSSIEGCCLQGHYWMKARYKSPANITTEMELCINSHNRTEVAICINNLAHIPTEVALGIKPRIHYNLNGTLYQ